MLRSPSVYATRGGSPAINPADRRVERVSEHHGLNVIVANGPAIQAAKTATTTIPIVFFAGGDPIKLGLVASLAQPGGNLTGVTNLGTELGPKRLELLHELVPLATSFAVLVNPTYPDAAAQSEAAVTRAAALKLRFQNIQVYPKDLRGASGTC